jgi:outer membrane receptor protein involved in Fe transport
MKPILPRFRAIIASRFAFVLAAGALLAVPAAPAQTAAPSSPSAADDKVIQLSPFVVAGEEVHGYGTTSAASASRIAVPITEIPTNVITINEKIIADTVAISAADTLNLIGGVSGSSGTTSNERNTVTARGYTSVGAQRDGFTDLLFGENGGFNYAFVERIEYVKGPNGILYGEHTPGGVLNFVSKRPLEKPRTRIGAMAGSYGFYRADLDTSNRLGDRGQFGYRLAASYMLNEGPLGHPGQVFADKGFTAINPIVSYRFENGVEAWVWTGFIRDQSPRMNRITKTFQLNGDGVAHAAEETLDDGYAHNLITSEAQVSTDNYEVGATKSFEFGRVRLDTRLLARYIEQFDSGALVTTTGSDTFLDKAGNVIGTDARTIDYSLVRDNLGGFFRTGVQTTGSDITTESSTYAADFAFSFDLGPTRHKLLLFAVRNELDRLSSPGINGRVYAISGVAGVPILEKLGAVRVGNVSRVMLYPPDQIAMAGISPETVVENATSFTVQSVTHTDSTQDAYGVLERFSFLDDRVFLVGGARHTRNDATVTIDAGVPSVTSDSNWTSGFGALGKVYKGKEGEVALFYNSNETFVPVYTLDQRLATFGQKYPNRTIAINEFGAKFDLLDSRLVATVSAFDIEEDNILITEIDDDGSITGTAGKSYQVPGGTRKSDGWEIDLAYNITRGFDTLISYGTVDARLENGMRPQAMADATASVLARYEVQQGALKGASLLWQYSWWGDSILSTRTNWKVPDGDIHTAVLGYRWKNVNFRLRVENVFDDLSMRPSVNETAVGVTNHRNYRVSVDYTF